MFTVPLSEIMFTVPLSEIMFTVPLSEIMFTVPLSEREYNFYSFLYWKNIVLCCLLYLLWMRAVYTETDR